MCPTPGRIPPPVKGVVGRGRPHRSKSSIVARAHRDPPGGPTDDEIPVEGALPRGHLGDSDRSAPASRRRNRGFAERSRGNTSSGRLLRRRGVAGRSRLVAPDPRSSPGAGIASRNRRSLGGRRVPDRKERRPGPGLADDRIAGVAPGAGTAARFHRSKFVRRRAGAPRRVFCENTESGRSARPAMRRIGRTIGRRARSPAPTRSGPASPGSAGRTDGDAIPVGSRPRPTSRPSGRRPAGVGSTAAECGYCRAFPGEHSVGLLPSPARRRRSVRPPPFEVPFVDPAAIRIPDSARRRAREAIPIAESQVRQPSSGTTSGRRRVPCGGAGVSPGVFGRTLRRAAAFAGGAAPAGDILLGIPIFAACGRSSPGFRRPPSEERRSRSPDFSSGNGRPDKILDTNLESAQGRSSRPSQGRSPGSRQPRPEPPPSPEPVGTARRCPRGGAGRQRLRRARSTDLLPRRPGSASPPSASRATLGPFEETRIRQPSSGRRRDRRQIRAGNAGRLRFARGGPGRTPRQASLARTPGRVVSVHRARPTPWCGLRDSQPGD